MMPWMSLRFPLEHHLPFISLTGCITKDAEYVSEMVPVNRLYHRQLFVRYRELELLENQWKCRVEIPSTECAGDVIIVSGPEFQVPQAIDQLLVSEPH